MSRFPIYPIWLKALVGHVDAPCRLKQKYQQAPLLHEEKKAFRAFAWIEEIQKQQTLIPGTCHMPHTWLNIYRSCEVEAKPKQCTTGASKISWTCRRSHSWLVLHLAVNVEQNLDCVMLIFLLKSHLCIETLLAVLQYQRTPIPSSHFRRNANFRGRAVNMGSISPEFRRGKEKST